MSTQGELVPREQLKVVALNEAASLMEVISRAASDASVDVDKLERLMAMYERIRAGNAAAEFSAAMAEMQNELPEITERGMIRVPAREGRSGHETPYALFEDINQAVKPILKKHGFAISFRTDIGDNKITVTGILMHRAGHREETTITLPADSTGSKNNVQAIGSSVSYGKRYTMSALLNITTRGEDDDGQRAGLIPISEQQLSALRDHLNAAGKNEAAFCKWLNVERLEDLPVKNFQKALAVLKKAQS